MESNKDDVILLEQIYQQRSFLHKKISLTLPICALLIVVFVLSAFIVSIFSLYWTQNTVCFVSNNEAIKPDQPKSRPVYYSRPKRSLTSRKADIPCFNFDCCRTSLNPNAPWNQSRLPTNVYPIDYQLTLELFELNEAHDEYSGTVDIVLEVRSATNDIILHGDLLLSNVTVTQRASPNNIPLVVDCAVPFPNTQTLIIHLGEQLRVGFTYDLRISFFRALSVHGTGIFENQFNKDPYGIETSRIILTHLKPVHAREAFPCFDEPGFKAKFQLTVMHENNTKALSNWDEEESFEIQNTIYTEFQTVPPIPTASIAFAIFYIDDFDKRTAIATHPITNRKIEINLWARKPFFTNDNGVYVDGPLNMIQRTLTAFLNIFQEVQTPIVPKQIDILAVPEYPSDAVSHWGLIIFSERSLLHNPETTSEAEHQNIALAVAKQIAEQWYGNFISFRWWTDLWLQEAISNYMKYHAVDIAYPEWNIHDQFYTGELLPTMFDDSLSTSHPILKPVNSPAQINELFDSIETTKATAILKMADYYTDKTTGFTNTTLVNIVSYLHNNEFGYLIPDEFLSKYTIGSWTGLDFFDRWILQSNFPKVFVRFLYNNSTSTYTFQLIQSRHLSAHMYDYDLYPPETNPFGYIWYIPIICRFSNNPTSFTLTRTFFLDQETTNINFNSSHYAYYYCNTHFAGYYIMDYTPENSVELGAALDNNNVDLADIDRANLLNGAFLNAQTTEESYAIVRSFTQFLYRTAYTDLLPWQTLSYHVNRMLDVLEYESLFRVVQKYFQLVVRNYYRTYEANLWNTNGTFAEQILKNIIIQLACRLRLNECIDKVTLLWNEAFPALVSGTANNSLAAHTREVVYQTHFQNTYNDTEWTVVSSDFHYSIDAQERYRLLKALTQSRQPWHLYQFLYRDAENNQDRDVDLLSVLTLLAKNPIGRELVWYYYRENWAKLQANYGRTNQRLGQLLIDITATFEDEFHEIELIEFLASTPGVDSNVDARFWALERANMNYWWIVDNSKDMAESFNIDEKHI
ncbi:unnamed protein product [Rotaria sp. Silwood1]|nr:unnamed protein product [Rotaria sp. Silwood1]CAF3531839.1 unnamed protein product [Rotaria sp. Silwood1]CAF4557464.1 unnamed protein product [Rotaria sp. Silwood1]